MPLRQITPPATSSPEEEGPIARRLRAALLVDGLRLKKNAHAKLHLRNSLSAAELYTDAELKANLEKILSGLDVQLKSIEELSDLPLVLKAWEAAQPKTKREQRKKPSAGSFADHEVQSLLALLAESAGAPDIAADLEADANARRGAYFGKASAARGSRKGGRRGGETKKGEAAKGVASIRTIADRLLDEEGIPRNRIAAEISRRKADPSRKTIDRALKGYRVEVKDN